MNHKNAASNLQQHLLREYIELNGESLNPDLDALQQAHLSERKADVEAGLEAVNNTYLKLGGAIQAEVNVHHLIHRLNSLLPQLQRAQHAREQADIRHFSEHIAELENKLNEYGREWRKAERNGETVYELIPLHTSQQTPVQRHNGRELTDQEIAILLKRLHTDSTHSDYLQAIESLRLVAMAFNAYFDKARRVMFQLSRQNPFANRMLNIREQLVTGSLRELKTFIEEQEEQAKRFTQGDKDEDLLTALPLYEHEDVLQAFVNVENGRMSTNRGSAQYQAFVASHFAAEEARHAWACLKAHADVLDQMPNLSYRISQLSQFYNQGIEVVRSMPNGATDSVATFVPIAAARPQFKDADGKPYANTQVLCWRYAKADNNVLGDFAVDRINPHLVTVGVLYTDANGKATMNKPNFLHREHNQVQLQVKPNNGDADVLLLEHCKGQAAQHLLPAYDDPLLSNWFSYGMEEHTQNINSVIDKIRFGVKVDGKQQLRNLNLSNIGMEQATGRLTELLSASKLTNFFELSEGYTYGFMLLPLGFGSLAINNLAELPNQEAQGGPLAIKQTMQAGDNTITLPRTLRQYALECQQIQAKLVHYQEHMQRANHQKNDDILHIEQLKTWLELHHQFPAGPIDEHNRGNQSALINQFSQLQQAIRTSQFTTAVNSELNDPSNRAKRAIYEQQRLAAEAFAAYDAAADTGFSMLNNHALMDKIAAWTQAQEDSDLNNIKAWGDEISKEIERAIIAPLDIFNPTTKAPWQPCTTLFPSIEAPYTALIFDKLLGVMQLLAQSHRSEELFATVCMPAVHQCLSDPQLDTILNQIVAASRRGENDGYHRYALEKEQRNFKNTLLLEEQNSALSTIINNPFYQMSKATFVRGPGAPALLEGLLDLTSMFLQKGYANEISVQVNLSLRVQVVRVALMTQLHVVHTQKPIVDLVVSFNVRANRLKPQRILSQQTLTDRFYRGDTWGTSNVRTRFEAGLKTVIFLVEQTAYITELMNNMDERHWHAPTEADFQSSLMQILHNIETGLTLTSSVLSVPAMVNFWRTIGKTPAQTASFLTKEITLKANQGARLLGSTGNQLTWRLWLRSSTPTTSVTALSVMATWANRLCFAAAAVATAKSLMEAHDHHASGRHYQAMRSIVLAAGSGSIVAGAILSSTWLLGANAMPLVGQMLFVGGTLIVVGMIAWDYYYEHWGRSHFYSNTFVYFDDYWQSLTAQPHFYGYADTEFGATEQQAQLVKAIHENYSRTLNNAGADLGAQARTEVGNAINITVTNEVNSRLMVLNAFLRLFGKEPHELQPYTIATANRGPSVSWHALNWLALPQLLAAKHHSIHLPSNEAENLDNIDYERVGKFISLEQDNQLLSELGNQNAGNSTAEAIGLVFFLQSIQRNAETYSHQPTRSNPPNLLVFATTLWPALVAGEFPEGYSIEDLTAAWQGTFDDYSISLLNCFLQRWQQLAELAKTGHASAVDTANEAKHANESPKMLEH